MENPATRALFLHFLLFRTEKLVQTQKPVILAKNQPVVYRHGLFFWWNHFEYPSPEIFYTVAKVTRQDNAELVKTVITLFCAVTPTLLRDF